ncbi:DUF2442 domain-containing protein [Candidatus Electronema sp. PJ]|uniref:DUF2442 domain-containing protein n=1 Tax=Candidatus Electronema sp. PJ TaxID=3401572 RepID=UPI003AA91176
MLEVRQAEYVGNYAVHLVFNNGRAGTADLEQLVFSDRRPVFARLRERASFSSFKVARSTVVWNDELDIAPEYLFYLAFKDDAALQEQFRQWGYASLETEPQASSCA